MKRNAPPQFRNADKGCRQKKVEQAPPQASSRLIISFAAAGFIAEYAYIIQQESANVKHCLFGRVVVVWCLFGKIKKARRP
jgi:hypothetical protein